MSSLTDIGIYELLPPNLQDAEAKALSAAIQSEFVPFMEQIRKVLIFADPDNLVEPVCDLLARIFDVYAYEQSFEITVKRKLVQGAILAKMEMGTAKAVQDILSAIYGTARIREWFDYAGDPFHFKVEVDVSETGIKSGTVDAISQKVEQYQNVRSQMEEIHCSLQRCAAARIGVSHALGSLLLIHPYTAGNIQAEIGVFAAGLVLYSENMIIGRE
jgi:phage tail P2-like protein